MKLKTVIGWIDKSYGDGLVARAFRTNKNAGDTLALFIAREIKDTFDPAATSVEQLEEAIRQLGAAQDELNAASLTLSHVLDNKCRRRDGCAILYKDPVVRPAGG